MRRLMKVLSGLLMLVMLTALGLAVLVFLDSRPLVPQDRVLTTAERAWARDWLSSAKPRGLREGERVTLTLSEREATIIGNYLIDTLGQGRFAARLGQDRARLSASLSLPWAPGNRFMNLDLTLAGGEQLPRIEQARFAGLPLPDALAQTIADRLIDALDQSRLLKRVDLKPDLALLTYEWHRDALANVGSGLVSAQERTRILGYQETLVSYGVARPRHQTIVLADLLSLVLSQARRQPPAAAVAENRAAILALTTYVNQQVISDPTRPATDVAFRSVTLRARGDLAQHFMVSATLAAQGGTALADLAGLYKELSDSRGGSGFSFADLAADRSGTRFGDLATGSLNGAKAVQEAARNTLTEADIMPPIEGLPEGMSEASFATAFKDTKSPAYRRVVAHIEQGIDALTLFQQATR
jgi:hypothetical protein